MAESNWAWTNELRIPSVSGAHQAVVQQVLEKLTEFNWGHHDVFGIELAMVEALVNAIKHGNRHDAEKMVHVVCKLSSERMRVEIADEGPGFNPDEVPDCTQDDRLDVPSGRGLMLIKNFMTLVEFNDCGNRVVMEKHKES